MRLHTTASTMQKTQTTNWDANQKTDASDVMGKTSIGRSVTKMSGIFHTLTTKLKTMVASMAKQSEPKKYDPTGQNTICDRVIAEHLGQEHKALLQEIRASGKLHGEGTGAIDKTRKLADELETEDDNEQFFDALEYQEDDEEFFDALEYQPGDNRK